MARTNISAAGYLSGGRTERALSCARSTLQRATAGTLSSKSMVEIFKGFLVLRLIALLALLVVVALVFGITSIARGSDVAGVAILAGGLVCGAAIGSLVARRRAVRR